MRRRRDDPPALALALLDRLIDENFGGGLVGDLVERFERDCAVSGATYARWHFWWETAVAIRYLGTWPSRAHPRHSETHMSSWLADVRLGARLLRRAPAFTILCVATLALAIGPTTAIFSVVEPLLVRPLPYPEPERLAFVFERNRNGHPITVGYATLSDVREHTTSLASVAAFTSWHTTLSSAVDPEKLIGSRITWNYFRTLGVRPALGRDFTSDEDAEGQAVVLLTNGLWSRRFGGDSSVVGRAVDFDGVPYTVVGVLPASFDDVAAPGAQIYHVLGYRLGQPWACRSCRHLHAVVRIRAGVPRERALAELNQLSARLVHEYPKEYSAAGMFLTPMKEEITRDSRPALFAILGAVILVLLIAAANVVNLQIARAVRRDAEFDVRIALGAGPGRLARQLVAEGLVIASVGGALGVALGAVTLPLLVARLPRTLARVSEIHLDVRVLGTIALIVVALAIVLGLMPARGARRRVLFTGALRGASRVASTGQRGTRAALVVGEVALALMLLASAGLLAKSLKRLLEVDAGFDPANLVTMIVQSSGPGYPNSASVLAFRRRAMDAVRAVPGVTDAGTSSTIPLGGETDQYGITAEDKPIDNPALAPYATGYRVDGDYLKTMKIPLLSGRDFSVEDTRDSAEAVSVVSASLAKWIWGSESPIGKRINVPNARAKWARVIGVAGDVRHTALDNNGGLAVYMPEEDWSWANADAALVVRTRGESDVTTKAVRAAVAALDPSQPITNVRSMDAVVSSSAAQRELALTLFAAFAILAVLLSAAGIYGLLAGSVAERTREIGLRSALGASRGALLRMVLGRGLGLAGAGVAVGVVGAFALTRYLQALLFGTAPMDGQVLVAAAALLLVVAVAACAIPALRAVRIDPMVALRD